MATVNLAPTLGAFFQAFTIGGLPLNAGLIYTYIAGGTTPQATYTTSAGSVQNANPIVLDADGRTPSEVWLIAGQTYRFDVKDSLGNLIKTYDNISGINDFETSGGSALIGFLQAGTGAVLRTVQAKLRDAYVNPEDFGATESASVDSQAGLQLAINTGKVVSLAGKTFAIGSQLVWNQNGGGIVGPGEIVMLTGGGQFTNTVILNKFNTNSCGIYVNGYDDVLFDNFKMRLAGTPSEDNVCIPIALRDSMRSTAGALKLTAFKKANGIISVDSCFDCNIVLNDIYDCSTNGAANGQITGVNVDDNRVSSVSSKRMNISYNSITNLTVGAGFLALYGYQTDGITISYQASAEHVITGNRMDVVGEGIDCWGNSCIISNNSISNAYIFGIKLIHGARYCKVTGNTITAAGLGGIVLAGSSTATQTTALNEITDNLVNAVNVDGNWNASTSYGIGYIGQGAATFDTANNTISGNTVIASANTKYGLLADDGAGTGNAWYDNLTVGNFASGVTYNPNADIFRAQNLSYVLASMGSAQVVPTGAFATVLYDTQTTDRNNEYDPTTGIFTASQPRTLSVTAQIRTAGATAGNKYELMLLHSAGDDPTYESIVAANNDFCVQITAVVFVNVAATLRIQLRHNKGSDVTLTNNANLTYLMISEV